MEIAHNGADNVVGGGKTEIRSVWVSRIHKELIKKNKSNKDFKSDTNILVMYKAGENRRIRAPLQMKGSAHADYSSNCILQTLVTPDLHKLLLASSVTRSDLSSGML